MNVTTKLIMAALLIPFISNAIAESSESWDQKFERIDNALRAQYLNKKDILNQLFKQYMQDHFEYMAGTKILTVTKYCYQGNYEENITDPLEINQHTLNLLKGFRYQVQDLMRILTESDIEVLLANIDTCIQELELRINKIESDPKGVYKNQPFLSIGCR